MSKTEGDYFQSTFLESKDRTAAAAQSNGAWCGKLVERVLRSYSLIPQSLLVACIVKADQRAVVYFELLVQVSEHALSLTARLHTRPQHAKAVRAISDSQH